MLIRLIPTYFIIQYVPSIPNNEIGFEMEKGLARINRNLAIGEFWTPIHIQLSKDDPLVTLCRLNFARYAAAPHETPMFKDLESLSECQAINIKVEPLSKLKLEMLMNNKVPIPPTGFVFHEGRVGSTLIANLLGSNPYSLVFSESDPPIDCLKHCIGCSREKKIGLFRDIIALMGVSPVHKYMFFKFQSITTTVMELALEVAIRVIILIYLHYP